MLIGIDPGHGGNDPGAIGRDFGTMEKDITLAISLGIEKILNNAEIDTFLTRTKDESVLLTIRTTILNQKNCNYVISVHINAASNRTANYISTFIQGRGGEAEKLAEKVQAQMLKATAWPDGGVRVANFHITRETRMPAILIECGFISNAQQERQLLTNEMQVKIASSVATGILEYIGKEFPQMDDWKLKIMQEAHQLKLIDLQHGHKPDDTATKWFVLAVAINLLKVKG